MADQVTSITGTPAQLPASNTSAPLQMKPTTIGVSEQVVSATAKPMNASTPTPTTTPTLMTPPTTPRTASSAPLPQSTVLQPLPKPQMPTSQQVFPPKPSTVMSPPVPTMTPPSPSSVPSPASIQKTIVPTATPPTIDLTQKPPMPSVSPSPQIPPTATSNTSSNKPLSLSSNASVLQTLAKPGVAPIPMKVGVGMMPSQAPVMLGKVMQESPTPMSPQSPGPVVAQNLATKPTSSPGSVPLNTSQQTPPASGQPPKEQPAMKMASPNDVKQSPFKFLPIILGVLALLGIVWFVITKFFGGGQTTPATKSTGRASQTTTTPASVKQTTLTYWGLWEPGSVMEQVLKDFSTANPGVVVNYVQQSPKDYRERLADALKKGTGPDVFRYHATWVPMLKSGLSSVPSSVISTDEYTKTFYPVVAKQLKTTDGFVGIPLMYDGLALYYNKQIFTTANLPAPTSWAEVESAARALTVRSKDKKIERAGIALGTTANVDNFSDILGLLILQNGGDPSQPSTKLVADSVRYYTNFYKSLKVWDETLPSSTYAFATEKAAMMIAPSWRAFEVKSINPNIQFAIAPVPQLPGTNVAWASYWAEGVAKTSKQQDVAWKFLKFMSSKDVLLKMHEAAATKTPRLFGEIYPRTDMTAGLVSDLYVGAFLSDAPKATSWWMASRTFDNGINDKIIKYYEDAVNAVNLGTTTPEEALKTTQQGVQQVLLQSQQ